MWAVARDVYMSEETTQLSDGSSELSHEASEEFSEEEGDYCYSTLADKQNNAQWLEETVELSQHDQEKDVRRLLGTAPAQGGWSCVSSLKVRGIA
jgi:hypothetical protein